MERFGVRVVLCTLSLLAIAPGARAAWQPNGLWLNIIKAVATAIATVGRFFAYRKWVFF